MKKEFIPYELALALRELGFDEPCFAYYNGDVNNRFDTTKPINATNWNENDEFNLDTSAPTFSQAFRWFREKYDCHHTIQHNKKYVGIAYSSVVNFSIDEFNTYEEAELGCLKKLIEIVKK